MRSGNPFRMLARLLALASLLVLPQLGLSQNMALSLSSASASPGGTITVDLSLASTGGSPAIVQWTLGFSSQHFTAVNTAIGPAGTLAGKTLQCVNNSGSRTCVLAAINTSTIVNGVIARVTLTVSPSITVTSAPLSLSSPVGASLQGIAISASATGSSITIGQVSNSPPVATSQSATTQVNTPVNITLQATDPNNDPLTFTVLSQPTHGTLSGTAPSLTYNPTGAFAGSDSFTFRASDGNLVSNTATVSLTVLSVNISSGIIGYWPFDASSGTAALDSSGLGHHGVVAGPSWTTGRVGRALDFHGTDDHVDVGSFDILSGNSGSNSLTIAAWVKADSFVAAADNRIVSKATGTSNDAHWWMLSTLDSGGEVRLRFRLKTNGSTSVLIASSGGINVGEWTHVAAVYNGSTMKLYKNGSEAGSMAKAGLVSVDGTIPVWIGANPGGELGWDGIIDEVRIYNRALAASEVQALLSQTTVSGNPCDLNNDGSVNVLDAQLGINQAIGVSSCGTGDIDLNGSCNVVDVQRLINAALGSACQAG